MENKMQEFSPPRWNNCPLELRKCSRRNFAEPKKVKKHDKSGFHALANEDVAIILKEHL